MEPKAEYLCAGLDYRVTRFRGGIGMDLQKIDSPRVTACDHIALGGTQVAARVAWYPIEWGLLPPPNSLASVANPPSLIEEREWLLLPTINMNGIVNAMERTVFPKSLASLFFPTYLFTSISLSTYGSL
jgi:hypothetical protein